MCSQNASASDQITVTLSGGVCKEQSDLIVGVQESHLLETRMNRVVLVSLGIVVAIVLAGALQAVASVGGDPQVRKSLIVSTGWLAQHLEDDALVLLHVGEKDEYAAGHIAGAQFIQLSDISTPRGEGLALELPAAAQLKTTFEKLGVSDKSRVVIYFGKDWVSPTARVFLTLDYLGLGDRTSILDGGLPAWRAEGRGVTTEVGTSGPGRITSHPQNRASWMPRRKCGPGETSAAILPAYLRRIP